MSADQQLAASDHYSKQALVTGGTGMLGRYLVARLLAEGVQVRALVRPTSDTRALQKLDVELVVGDMTDQVFLAQTLAGCDLVYHTAGYLKASATFGDTDKRDTNRYWKANVVLTEDLLTVSLAQKVSRFTFISSSSVYGSDVKVPIHENTPTNPETIYGRSKLAAEQLGWSYQRRGLPVTVIRPGVFYGSGDRHFLPVVLGLSDLPALPMVDGGRARHDLVYAGDVANLVWLASQSPKAAGRVYNAGSGQPLTVREIVEIIARVLGRGPKIYSVSRSLATRMSGLANWYISRQVPEAKDLITPITIHYLSKDVYFDIFRARNELGFRPEYGFEEGLRKVMGKE